ncbi:hypothetical protein D3C72_1199930 [compost metagenome]
MFVPIDHFLYANVAPCHFLQVIDQGCRNILPVDESAVLYAFLSIVEQFFSSIQVTET